MTVRRHALYSVQGRYFSLCSRLFARVRRDCNNGVTCDCSYKCFKRNKKERCRARKKLKDKQKLVEK